MAQIFNRVVFEHMTKKKITISDVNKKRLRIVVYLLLSGALGWLLATYVAKNEMLTVVLTPVINFILYSIKEELDKQGYIKAIRG